MPAFPPGMLRKKAAPSLMLCLFPAESFISDQLLSNFPADLQAVKIKPVSRCLLPHLAGRESQES